MLSLGIDVGSRRVKVVLLSDETILGKGIREVGFKVDEDVSSCIEEVFEPLGISMENVDAVGVTGSGRGLFERAHFRFTEITADARGAFYIDPECKTCIDIGAEESRVLRIKEGKVLKFAVNDRCAAGAGIFLETMARALEMDVEGFDEAALKGEATVPLNAQCVVFAESEVISLIHSGHSPEEIARAVYDAMALRIASMAGKVGVEDKVLLIGGVARSRAFRESLSKILRKGIHVPEMPEFVGAIGAALLAREKRNV